MATNQSADQITTDGRVETWAGYAAYLTALAGVAYAIAFVILKSSLGSAVFLLLGSSLSLFVLVTVYERFKAAEPTIARVALVFAAVGAAGAAIHGGFDLASVLHPEQAVASGPNPVDPRGLLTFGASGIALVAGSVVVARMPGLPTWATWLALAAGVALIVTYLGRLIVLDANSPLVLGPALVAGVLSPVVYIAAGLWLTRDAAGSAPASAVGIAPRGGGRSR